MTNDTRDRSDRDVMAPARRPMILVIDDQPQILALYSRALSTAGYQTEVAGSAEAALARIRKTPPDAILVDLKMPYINGMGLLYRLREFQPDMPVAVLTGASNVDDRTIREVEALHAALHFKPLSNRDLLHVAGNLVGASLPGRDACVL